jgi:hypothetical protein
MNLALVGAQLQFDFDNDLLYLYSGNNNGTFFQGLCAYIIANRNWTYNNSIPTNSFANSTDGGGCFSNGYLYSFFGWTYNGSDCVTSFGNCPEVRISSISRLNLNSLAEGWTQVQLSDCDAMTSISSFGYTIFNDSFYVVGGYGNQNLSNSIFYIPLNNSATTLSCNVLKNELSAP